MAGKTCPGCKQQTFFASADGGRACSKCGFKMKPAISGKKGSKCTNCGKYTVRKNHCSHCGVTYQY